MIGDLLNRNWRGVWGSSLSICCKNYAHSHVRLGGLFRLGRLIWRAWRGLAGLAGWVDR
jgi:hypothetical protein